MRRTPVLASRSSRPALRHDPSGSPYLDYRSREAVEPQQDAADADEEPTERLARVGTPRVQALPPIFARRLDPRAEPEPEPEPVTDALPDARGVARFFDWLGRPRPGG